MSGLNKLASVFCVVALMTACELPFGPGRHSVISPSSDSNNSSNNNSAGKAITTNAEAQALFRVLKSSAEAVDSRITAPFNGSTSVPGASGRASVTGKKTSTSTSSSTSSSTTRSTDLQIAFTDFTATGSTLAVAGNVRWFDNFYSRTACSSISCASSSSRSESMTGTSVRVEFQLNGTRYSDVINVDARSPDYTSTWTVKITNRSGQLMSFSF